MCIQSVPPKTGLDQVLGLYYGKGFRIQEPDDHFMVELWYRGERIAVFSAAAATEKSIREVCVQYVADGHAKIRDERLREQGWR